VSFTGTKGKGVALGYKASVKNATTKILVNILLKIKKNSPSGGLITGNRIKTKFGYIRKRNMLQIS
jgi:hypothetical protein